MIRGSSSSLRIRTAVLAGVLSLLANAPARSVPLGEILEDLNVEGYSIGSAPEYLGTVGGRAVFEARGDETATVWITDGTPEGTKALDIGRRNDYLIELTPLGTAGTHLFLYERYQAQNSGAIVAVDAQGAVTRVLRDSDGWELYGLTQPSRRRVTGGSLAITAWNLTAQTFVLSFIDGDTLATSAVLSSASGGVLLLGAIGSELVFWVGEDSSPQGALWKSAGSVATTAAYATVTGQIDADQAAAGEHVVYFTLREGGEIGTEIWATHGGSSGTTRLTAFADPAPQIGAFHLDADRAFFTVNDATLGQELFASDATPDGTRAVTAFGYHQPFGYNEALVAIAGGQAYVVATDGLGTYRLWLAGDRPEELRPLVENVVFDSSQPWLATAGGSVFVATSDAEGSLRLIASDGTESGTHEVLTGCVAPCFSYPRALASTSSTFYFTGAHSGAPAETVYSTRPPFRSAVPLYDPLREGPIIDYSTSRSVAAAGEVIYFAASQGSGLGEPWITAGTPATTSMIRRLGIFESAARAARLRTTGGALAFTVDHQSPARVMLRSTASSELGPVPGNYDVCYYGTDVYPVEGRFIFRDCSSDFWSVETSGGAATRLTELYSDTSDRSVANGEVVGFLRWSGSDYQAWRIGGSPPTAILAQTLAQDLGYWELYVAGTKFILDVDLESNRQLYSLGDDLTQFEPLSPVFADVEHWVGSAELGRAFFEGREGDYVTTRVWTTDGTVAGTRRLFPEEGYGSPLDAVRLADGWAVLAGVQESGPFELQIWKTNGTPEGSTLLTAIPQDTDLTGARLVALGERLLFTRRTEAGEVELWSVPVSGGDSTALLPAGTSLAGTPAQIVATGERAYFNACDREHGCELWTTAGTPESTRLSHDIYPGPPSSSPSQFLAVGNETVFVADDGLHGIEPWHVAASAGDDCAGRQGALCLEGERYLVQASFKAPAERRGDGQEIPLTSDTGAFWFFDPSNVELIVKAIDGGGFNGHEWVFYGALSNVEYSLDVADALTGEARRYFNPAGRFASAGDIEAFLTLSAAAAGPNAENELTALAARFTEPESRASSPRGGNCSGTATRFCVLDGRFSVEATWRDFQGNTGIANAVGWTDDTGYFWFFAEENVEVVVKAIDGSDYNGQFWIYYGALSNVEYTFTVTDTLTGAVRRYSNPLGTFGSSGDIAAFPAN